MFKSIKELTIKDDVLFEGLCNIVMSRNIDSSTIYIYSKYNSTNNEYTICIDVRNRTIDDMNKFITSVISSVFKMVICNNKFKFDIFKRYMYINIELYNYGDTSIVYKMTLDEIDNTRDNKKIKKYVYNSLLYYLTRNINNTEDTKRHYKMYKYLLKSVKDYIRIIYYDKGGSVSMWNTVNSDENSI